MKNFKKIVAVASLFVITGSVASAGIIHFTEQGGGGNTPFCDTGGNSVSYYEFPTLDKNKNEIKKISDNSKISSLHYDPDNQKTTDKLKNFISCEESKALDASTTLLNPFFFSKETETLTHLFSYVDPTFMALGIYLFADQKKYLADSENENEESLGEDFIMHDKDINTVEKNLLGYLKSDSLKDNANVKAYNALLETLLKGDAIKSRKDAVKFVLDKIEKESN